MAQISTSEQPNMEQIDLTALNVQQLATWKQQLEDELSLSQESLTSLKMAQTKFVNSAEAIDQLTSAVKGKDILVPLTGSDLTSTQDYFSRKTKFITEQMEKVQMVCMKNSKISDTIIEIAK